MGQPASPVSRRSMLTYVRAFSRVNNPGTRANIVTSGWKAKKEVNINFLNLSNPIKTVE